VEGRSLKVTAEKAKEQYQERHSRTMKTKFCLLLILLAVVAAASAQTNTTAPKQAATQADKQPVKQAKGKLTVEFSKAAVRLLVAVSRIYEDSTDAAKERANSALNDAEAVAQGGVSSPDSMTLQSLRQFFLARDIESWVINNNKEAAKARGTPSEYESVVGKDADCVRTWKLALQKRESNLPKECKAYAATEADK
jgi:hypothetical protein